MGREWMGSLSLNKHYVSEGGGGGSGKRGEEGKGDEGKGWN